MMSVVRLCLALTALPLTASSGLADDVFGTWLRDNGLICKSANWRRVP
jgi:hypothetical protein